MKVCSLFSLIQTGAKYIPVKCHWTIFIHQTNPNICNFLCHKHKLWELDCTYNFWPENSTMHLQMAKGHRRIFLPLSLAKEELRGKRAAWCLGKAHLSFRWWAHLHGVQPQRLGLYFCGFCSNRILPYFPLSVCMFVCVYVTGVISQLFSLIW